jgi:hypothetical protein
VPLKASDSQSQCHEKQVSQSQCHEKQVIVDRSAIKSKWQSIAVPWKASESIAVPWKASDSQSQCHEKQVTVNLSTITRCCSDIRLWSWGSPKRVISPLVCIPPNRRCSHLPCLAENLTLHVDKHDGDCKQIWYYCNQLYSGHCIFPPTQTHLHMNELLIKHALFENTSKRLLLLCSSIFLGAFANCEMRLLYSSRLSIRLSLRPHGKTRLPLDEFSLNLIFEYLSKNLSRKFKVSVKCEENNRHSTWRQNISDHTSLYSSQNEKCFRPT